MKNIKMLLVVIIIIGALALTGCQSAMASENEPKEVSTINITEKNLAEAITYQGYVKAKDTKNYAFLQGGRLEAVYIKEGEKITAGQLLATKELDDTTTNYSISKQAAQVNVDLLKSKLDSATVLYKEGGLAEKEYETLKASYDLAVNQLERIQASYNQAADDSNLYASADGYVMKVPYKAGEVVAGGYPIVVTKGEEQVVTIGVSADDFAKITIETKVLINDTVAGKIDTISLYPDEATRTYGVDILITGQKLPIGQIVNVSLITGETKAYTVPISSVIEIDGVNYVYSVEKKDDKYVAKRTEVVLGEVKGNEVVLTNITKNLTVITNGIKNIKENDIVQI